MFVVLIYDVDKKRDAKTRKIVKKYLIPIQESVFEGNLTEGKLKKLKEEIERIIDCDYDSVIIYKIDSEKMIKKNEIGIKKTTDLLLV